MVLFTTDDCMDLSHTICRNFWHGTEDGVPKSDWFDLHKTFNKGELYCPHKQPDKGYVTDKGVMLFFEDHLSALISFKSFCYHFSLGNTALAWERNEEDWVVITDALEWDWIFDNPKGMPVEEVSDD